MRRILIGGAILLAIGAFVVLAAGASPSGNAQGTYKIELDNAFGLVNGADFKVAGVRAGKISTIDLCGAAHDSACQNPLHALVTVNVTESGFGVFRSDAFCQSRPQSLIGEYFIDCSPGLHGSVLKPGSTIPVTHTESTIPADLVQNVMRLPYRQRFTLIINELGAAVASRSDDLQSALQRAVPALTETDNLLNLLANDSQTIRSLNVNANQVIKALADNSTQVERFIDETNNISRDTATQVGAFQQTWHDLPAFLEQLQPAMQKLGAAADAQDPVLVNLNQSAAQLRRFFVDLVPFSNSSHISIDCGEGGQPACPAGGSSLGSVSVTGKPAVQAAAPTIQLLNKFAKPTPELAQNLRIVLQDLNRRNRAAERDPRSPAGGSGYTGLEALLQYAFNQSLALNTFGPYGHMLTVDAFYNAQCSPYATQQTVAQNLAGKGPPGDARTCYSWLGPNQQGINEPDPSNPGACVPDPGGHPPDKSGPSSGGACRLAASSDTSGSGASAQSASTQSSTPTSATTASTNGVGAATGNAAASTPGAATSGTGAPSGATGSSGGSSSGGQGQAQQLLNYLLAP